MLTHWRIKKNHLNWCRISFCKVQHSFMIKILQKVSVEVTCSWSTSQPCLTLRTLWTGVCQALFSMEFSRQEYWSGFPFPTPRDRPEPGIVSCISSHWQVDLLPLLHLRSTEGTYFNIIKWVQASQVVLAGKNLPANAGDVGEVGSIPGSGRSPERRHGNSLQNSCLENPIGRGAWQAIVCRVAQSQTRLKWLNMHSGTWKHLTANFILSGERLKAYHLRSGIKQGGPLFYST